MNEMKKGRNPLPGVSPTLRDRQQGVFYMLHLKEEVQQATAFDEPVVSQLWDNQGWMPRPGIEPGSPAQEPVVTIRYSCNLSGY